jgi:TrmH family RNA methyltransferase
VKRINSSRNPELRARAKLKERRAREREGRFLIEGTREVQRALEAGVRLEAFYHCPALLGATGHEVIQQAQTQSVPLTELSEQAFKVLSYREHPDGVVAVAQRQAKNLADLSLPADALVLVVEGLEKPGNLGALLRTADSAGVHALFATGGGTDLENPNVIRASMGSLFSRPVLAVSKTELLPWLQAERFSLVATTPHTDTLYWDAAYTGRTAVLLGAEHEGLSEAWLEAANVRVKIPMSGLADSLNVATTGALLLYEALRQRRQR